MIKLFKSQPSAECLSQKAIIRIFFVQIRIRFSGKVIVRMALLSNISWKELASNAEAAGNIYRPVSTETIYLVSFATCQEKGSFDSFIRRRKPV